MALREQASKSAVDTCETFKQVLADLTKAKEGEKNPIGVQILAAIIRSMTDNAATEVKTMDLIETYINETLPLMKVIICLLKILVTCRSVCYQLKDSPFIYHVGRVSSEDEKCV